LKLLFDENLSRKLVLKLVDLFPESTHAVTVGLVQSSDLEIWNYARDNDFIVVTADGDFYEMAAAFGAPPKVIWLRGCDYPTKIAAQILRDQIIRVREFINDKARSILILKP
jgi:predicted nuclease of predicted toxin-antitoxin system